MSVSGELLSSPRGGRSFWRGLNTSMGLDSGCFRASVCDGDGEPEVAVPPGARGGLQYLGHAHSGEGKDQDPQQEGHLLHPWGVVLLAAGQDTRKQVGPPAAEESGLEQYG